MTSDQLQQLSNPNYLADFKLIHRLLAEMVNRILARLWTDLAAGLDGAGFGEAAAVELRALARVFLGLDPRYIPIPWFSPGGGVDDHLACVEGIHATDPEERVVMALDNMLRKILDVVAANENVEAAEWMPQVSAIVSEYACKVLGIPAGTCAVKG